MVRAHHFNTLLLAIVSLVLLAATALIMAGCAPQATEMERISNRVIDEVIKPAVTQAMEDTTMQTAALQGNVHFNNAGYNCSFEGFWVTGVKGECTVRLVGVDGGLTGSTQAAASQPAAN